MLLLSSSQGSRARLDAAAVADHATAQTSASGAGVDRGVNGARVGVDGVGVAATGGSAFDAFGMAAVNGIRDGGDGGGAAGWERDGGGADVDAPADKRPRLTQE